MEPPERASIGRYRARRARGGTPGWRRTRVSVWRRPQRLPPPINRDIPIVEFVLAKPKISGSLADVVDSIAMGRGWTFRRKK
jgi:hypothetical protein